MAKTVLVVDDSSAMRALLGVGLSTAGYAVEEARDGREALERVQRGGVDAIVSDCIMPVMDGMTLVREIKGREGLRGIPIIMLTTESQGAQIREARSLGIQAWIVKPFRPEQLLDAVRRFCPA